MMIISDLKTGKSNLLIFLLFLWLLLLLIDGWKTNNSSTIHIFIRNSFGVDIIQLMYILDLRALSTIFFFIVFPLVYLLHD